MFVVVTIENGEGEQVKVIEMEVKAEWEIARVGEIIANAFALEESVKKFVEGKAEGEKSGE